MIDEDRGCDPHPEDGSPSDCGTAIAVPYFIAFTIIGGFIMLNLVVAVILENFTSLGNVNPDLVSTNDITEFKEAWGVYDPDADGMIPAKDLPKLVMGLTPKNGQVGFRNTLDALVQRNYAEKKVDVAGG